MKNKRESKYFGEVGGSGELELTLVKSFDEYKFVGGTWGETVGYTHKLVDAAGHIFVWKTKSRLWDDVHDQPFTRGIIHTTIKGHCEFKGEKQTILTRCKVLCVLQTDST